MSRAIVLPVIPAETPPFHVLGLLLWQDQHERGHLGECDKPGLVVELSGGLGAAMEGHDQRQAIAERGRPVSEHQKLAWVVAELGHGLQRKSRTDVRQPVQQRHEQQECAAL